MQFSPRLLPGERLIWTGLPAPGVRLRAIDWLLIPFSLMWGGFAIFWEAAALGIGVLGASSGSAVGGFALLFPLWGLPFVAIGLFLIFGRFALDSWLRGGVAYALTDQRVIIDRRRGGRSLSTAELTNDIRLSGLRRDGRGTVEFGPDLGRLGIVGRGFGSNIWVPALGRSPEFAMIADAEQVFELALRQVALRRRQG